MEITVKSRYLDRDFSVVAHEAAENGLIISHDSLVDIIDNQIPPEMEIHYDFALVKSEKNHVVVTCTISDAKNRRIKDLGEATPDSLDTKISKNYPCLMAYYRAFDRAVIRYLAFPGKVFSSTEGVPAATDKEGENAYQGDNQPTKVQNAPQGPETQKMDPNAKAEKPAQTPATAARETALNATTSAAANQTPTKPEELGKLRLTFGKFNGLSIAEAYTKDPGYFGYMYKANVDGKITLNPTKKAQVVAGLDYAKMVEVKNRGS